MAHVTATRSELLARRERIALAELGRDVLRQKRDQLMEEFRKLADVVLAGSGALEQAASEARRTLAFANAALGSEAVAAAALATRPELSLRAGTTTVMGIRFPDIEYDPVARPRTDRGYSLVATGAHIDGVAESFETVVDLVLRLAADELRLRRIVEILDEAYGRPVLTPRYAPVDELVFTVLSQNTADVNTERSFAALKARFQIGRASCRERV